MELKRKKTAKDLAFDKERIKFRREIERLESDIISKKTEIARLEYTIVELEMRNRQTQYLLEESLKLLDLSLDKFKKWVETSGRMEDLGKLSPGMNLLLQLSTYGMLSANNKGKSK